MARAALSAAEVEVIPLFGEKKRLASERDEANDRAREAYGRAQQAAERAREAAERAERAERERDLLKKKYEPPVTVRPHTVPSAFETTRSRH